MLINILIMIVVLYFIYVFVTAVVLFYVPLHKGKDLKVMNTENFYGKKESTDRVMLLENGYFSGLVRMQMIQEARHTIDIAYFSIGKGRSSDLLMGALFEAADRGIRIRVLLDGISHGLKGKRKNVLYALAFQNNIELKYYEPFTILKPWTWHNRLHDKIIVVDGQLGISGGRNIGDKYLASQPDKNFVYDRDVLIYNTKQESNSVILSMEKYVEKLWNHPYTRKAFPKLKKTKQFRGLSGKKLLIDQYEEAKKANEPFVHPYIVWRESTMPTRKVSFITNPIQRMNKSPFIWKTFIKLSEQAEKSIVVQSPYIVPTKEMEQYIDKSVKSKVQRIILTNSITSTPNAMAFSAYLGVKNRVIKAASKLYEYQQPYSIHGKSVVYDQRLSAVGSFNLDSRSVFLNTESMVMIDSEEFAAELTGAIETKISHSTLVGNEGEPVDFNTDSQKNVPPVKSALLHILSVFTRFWRHFV